MKGIQKNQTVKKAYTVTISLAGDSEAIVSYTVDAESIREAVELVGKMLNW